MNNVIKNVYSNNLSTVASVTPKTVAGLSGGISSKMKFGNGKKIRPDTKETLKMCFFKLLYNCFSKRKLCYAQKFNFQALHTMYQHSQFIFYTTRLNDNPFPIHQCWYGKIYSCSEIADWHKTNHWINISINVSIPQYP